MIYKRFAANLRAQNWFAIGIEFAIVVAGVFVGTQVSNWNEERIEQAETVRMLSGLKPELRNQVQNFTTIRDYYAITRRYAATAFAGWRGDPAIGDRDFVIAAYQASQNTFSGINQGSWSQIFGADRFHAIDDQELRTDLAVLMTQDYGVLEKEVFTPYRENVRKVIPEDIQDAIRAQCGDQRVGRLGFVRLPPTCGLQLPEERWREGAAALRARPDLQGEMRWHFAAVASFVDNLSNLRDISARVLRRIERI